MRDYSLPLFIGLARMLDSIDRDTDRLLRPFDLTRGQFAVLEALYHKGDLCIGDVQRLILTTTGNIPVIVKNLETRGLLTRQQDPNDRRRFILHLTPSGLARMDAVFPTIANSIASHLSVFTPVEQRALLKLVLKYRKETNDHDH